MTNLLSERIGVVVIGRNEGERLKRCINSLLDQKIKIITYVDSGSTDASVDFALKKGVDVIDLDTSQSFTMARGRNAGLMRLKELHPEIEYVQFVDGDCEVDQNWIKAGLDFIDSHNEVTCVCGFRQERSPEHSIYNRLINLEWQGAIGQIKACGGDAIYRMKNILKVNGFNPAMIAGEEADLCIRLAKKGGIIWRIDHGMTIHDASIYHFSEWWKRSVRCGHAYAEGFSIHGAAPDYHNRKQIIRSLLYGLALPLASLIFIVAALFSGSELIDKTALLLGALLILAWLKICFSSYRFRRHLGNSGPESILYSLFMLLVKFPEVQGIFVYMKNRILGKASTLIEYHSDSAT
ncbi:MAG: glycosyltransferase [Candidatus Sedimenticola sp. (ex Thyasira tokunagai)]